MTAGRPSSFYAIRNACNSEPIQEVAAGQDFRPMLRPSNVRFGSSNETARAVGRCGMAVPAIDGTMRASYLMMMRGQKQIVQHDDLAISSTALGAHRT